MPDVRSQGIGRQAPALAASVPVSAPKAAADDASRRFFVVVVVLLLSLPIELLRTSAITLSVSSLAAPLGLLCLLFGRGGTERFLLLTAIILGMASATFVGIFEAQNLTLRPFLSCLYFFHSCLLFFVGQTLVRNEEHLRDLFGRFASTQSLIALAVLPSVIGRAAVQYSASESCMVFNGTFLGLPLFGWRGYNSLMVYFATAFSIVLIRVGVIGKCGRGWMLYVPGMAALSYLVLFALSRQAILGLLLFLVLAGIVNIRIFCFISVALVGLWLATVYSGLVDSWLEVWDSRLSRSYAMLMAGDLESLSTNRFEIYAMQLDDLARNPLTGNGFHGFELHGINRGRDSSLVGLSPHNQYLGAVWKMGVVAAVFYFGFLIRAFSGVWHLAMTERTGLYRAFGALCVVYLLLYCMVQDALLFPLNGALIMFLLGAHARVWEERVKQSCRQGNEL